MPLAEHAIEFQKSFTGAPVIFQPWADATAVEMSRQPKSNNLADIVFMALVKWKLPRLRHVQ
jgi:hypothetical protein